MNTVFLLMAEFGGQADIPLSQVAPKYLGINDEAKQKRLAAGNDLPFPVFRIGGQKSPWLVRITDLAEYADRAKAEAEREWRASNG